VGKIVEGKAPPGLDSKEKKKHRQQYIMTIITGAEQQ